MTGNVTAEFRRVLARAASGSRAILRAISHTRVLHFQSLALRATGGPMTRILVVLCTVFCLLSTSRGQYFEATVYLPDSFGGLTYPRSIAWNPMNDQVYVAGELGDCVIAIDARTLEKVARIPSGRGGAALICTQPDNKVYCANESTGTVTIIDATRNAAVGDVVVCRRPAALCHNTSDDKVYCANLGGWSSGFDSIVSVIDGRSDTVTASIVVGYFPIDLCYNPQNNKVYCVCNYYPGKLVVIDAARDSVIASPDIGCYPIAACYAASENKVYCATTDYDFHVRVIDGTTDSVIASVVSQFNYDLDYSPELHRVYTVCDERNVESVVRVIDAVGDTLIAVLGVPGTQ
jgi:DNA-binding beta-propeller fold protein YncE